MILAVPEYAKPYIPAFEEYNGWTNKATWSVYTDFTSFDASRIPFERCVHQL